MFPSLSSRSTPPRPLTDLELISHPVGIGHDRTLLRRGPASAEMVFLLEGEAEVVISEGRAGGGAEDLVCGRLYAGQSAGAFGLLGLRPLRLASVRTRGPALVRILDEGGWNWLRSQQSSLELEFNARVERELRLHIEVLSRLLARQRGRVAPERGRAGDARGLAAQLAALEAQIEGTEEDRLLFDQLRMLELSARGAAGAV